jgi:hypothetical protein
VWEGISASEDNIINLNNNGQNHSRAALSAGLFLGRY